MKEHLLQSTAWESYERLENRQTFRLENNKFSTLAILERTPLGNYLFVPYGPTISFSNPLECQRNFHAALQALTKLAQENRVFFIRIEPPFNAMPAKILRKTFCLQKSHDIDPAHTWVLDLTQPEAKIFAHMEKEKGRLWRNRHKKGISIRQTKNPDELGILIHFLIQVGAQNHFIPQKKAHLQNQMRAGFATLYVAELNGQPIAAALVYDHDDTRYYAHAAAAYKHRKLAAGSILLVQMIADAKRAGMQTFDFWGITTSEDSRHPWYGFTQFKKSFGGEQVNYAGTWDLPINKSRYLLYRIVRKLNRWRRKLYHRK